MTVDRGETLLLIKHLFTGFGGSDHLCDQARQEKDPVLQ